MPCDPLFTVSSRLMQLYTMPSLMSRHISAPRNTVRRSEIWPLCDVPAVRDAVDLDRTLCESYGNYIVPLLVLSYECGVGLLGDFRRVMHYIDAEPGVQK